MKKITVLVKSLFPASRQLKLLADFKTRPVNTRQQTVMDEFNILFFTNFDGTRIERRLRKSQVNVERLGSIFKVS